MLTGNKQRDIEWKYKQRDIGWKPIAGSRFPDIFDFKKKKELVGHVSQVKTVSIRRGKKLVQSKIAYIVDSDGVLWGVWQSAALEGFFGEIKKGMEVKIQYRGLLKIKGQKNPMKDFVTFARVAKATKTPVSGR